VFGVVNIGILVWYHVSYQQ